MMRQTLALLTESYRELNSKKLFWITLLLSGLVVAAFSGLGVNKSGVSLFVWTFELPGVNSDRFPPDQFYKVLFTEFGIKFWLAWIGTVLALISTAGMFPDLIAGGAIELTLSKPISRIRLFLTKYVLGLLFVTMQVTVFTTACFILIAIRGKSIEPGLFLAIPLVVILFSYLFSICVLIGLLTRSTIASLLLTLLCWLGLFCINVTDVVLIQGREVNLIRQESLTARIERMEKNTAAILERARAADAEKAGVEPPSTPPTQEEIEKSNPRIAEARKSLESAKKNQPNWELAANAALTVKTLLPKTSETVSLLERELIRLADLPKGPGGGEVESEDFSSPLFGVDQEQLQKRTIDALHNRTAAWVIGTSLAFEAFILAIAAWIFCRRDF